jgi:non-canonical (house-cleaning) NTP pyrophosphatase
MIIHIGSGNQKHKVEPIERAARRVAPTAELIIVPHPETESGVPAQPDNWFYAVQGALNRAAFCWAPGTISIAAEGAIVDLPVHLPFLLPEKGNHIKDIKLPKTIDLCGAVLCCISPTGEVHFSTSTGMQFPQDAVNETRHRMEAGDKDTTIGKVLAEVYGGDHQDPRTMLSHGLCTRANSIEEAAVLALLHVLKQS